MKKVKLLLIGIIGVFAMSTLKVDASITTTHTDSTTNIKVDVQKVTVAVYNKKGIGTIASPSGTDFKEEEIADGFTFTPDSRIHQMHDKDLHTNYDLIEIRLKPSQDLATIQNTVKAKASTLVDQLEGGDGDKYLVVLNVNYKIDSSTLKEGYNKIWDIDSRYVFSGTQDPDPVDEANGSNGLNQMLMTGIINKSTKDIDWSQRAQMNYEDAKGQTYVFSSFADSMPLFDEFFLLPNGRNAKGEEKYRLMLHIMNDVTASDYYGEERGYYKSSEDLDLNDDGTPVNPSSSNSSNNKKKNETITGVPNTDARSMSITLFGSSLLALGSAVVIWELRKKFNQ